MRVVVIGGGINGLLTTRELQAAGAEVVLLERGELGQEASWAGGGIVSPLYPWRYPPAVTALASWAQQAYPLLAADLLDETGMDVELEHCGLLFVDAPDARDARVWAARQGMALEVLDQQALQARWCGLAADASSGLFLPGLANVRNPRLLKALLASLRGRAGIFLREQAEVVSLRSRAGAGPCVTLADGEEVAADAVVVCGGAWSGRLLAGCGVDLPVRPVRGQMQLYKLAPGELPCMVMRGGHYVIPRRDGHVLCGSTLEEAGFDKSTTTTAHDILRQAAARLWPALTDAPLLRQWAGLRPGSPNGIPFIAAVPGQEGIWVNAGQFRNGLVLAPASARLLADLVLGRAPALDPLPYSLPG